MKLGGVQHHFRKRETRKNEKKSFINVTLFIMNFDNFETFITYHNVLLEVCFIHTHTQKNYRYNFLLEFQNCSCNKDFLPLFPSAY